MDYEKIAEELFKLFEQREPHVFVMGDSFEATIDGSGFNLVQMLELAHSRVNDNDRLAKIEARLSALEAKEG